MVIDGNPILWTCEILILFGVVSAFLESVMWRVVSRGVSGGQSIRRSLLAHALGVPLALVILLIPSRPYPGYEAVANVWRSLLVRHRLGEVYFNRLDQDGTARQFRNVDELEHRLDELGGYGVCLYPATYPRFATHDPRVNRYQVDLNPKPSTKDIDWLLRVHEPLRTLEVNSGMQVTATNKQTSDR